MGLLTESFWLNAHLDPTCVSAGNCQSSDIVWEDGGPGFDESLYDGWLGMNIDARNLACVNVSITRNGISQSL